MLTGRRHSGCHDIGQFILATPQVECIVVARSMSCLLRTLPYLFLTSYGLALLATPVFLMGKYIIKPPEKNDMEEHFHVWCWECFCGRWECRQSNLFGLLFSSAFLTVVVRVSQSTPEFWNIQKALLPYRALLAGSLVREVMSEKSCYTTVELMSLSSITCYQGFSLHSRGRGWQISVFKCSLAYIASSRTARAT